MAKKVKITKGGQTVYPATVMDAVVHPDLRVDSSKLIEEVNVSKIYPKGGIDGTNKYTLETAIAKIPSSLRNVGLKCSFINEEEELETWEYQGGTFTDAGDWTQIGAKRINEIGKEPTLFDLSAHLSSMLQGKGMINYSYFTTGICKSGHIAGNYLSEIYQSSYAYCRVTVYPGMAVTISSWGGSVARLWVITDKDDKILSAADVGIDSTKNPVTINIDDEKAYFLYVNNTNFESVKDNTYISYEVTDYQEQIDNINAYIEGNKKYWDFPILTGNTYYGVPNSIGGKVQPYNFSTGVGIQIPCRSGDKFNIKARGGSTVYKYYVTDGENNILSLSKSADISFDIESLVISEENAAYLYVNTLDAADTPHEDAFVERLEDKQARITDAASEVFVVKCSGKPWADDNLFTVRNEDFLTDSEEYEDYCYYVQPDCKDAPCKLVLYCHGGGQGVGMSGGGLGYQVNNLLTKLGYAQLVCNCYPDAYMSTLGLPTGPGNSAPVLNWTIPQQYVAAYNYVIEKYNIDRNGVYLLGMSQGGGTAENVAELTDIPIIAECIMAPAISLQYIQTSVRPSYVAALYGINSINDFTKDKVHGLDPFTRNVDKDTIYSNDSPTEEECKGITAKKFRKNIPLLILQGEIDTTCNMKYVISYAKMIRNAGGMVEMVIYNGIGHADLIQGNAGTLDGESYGAPSIEAARWFEKFGGYSTEQIVIL